MAQMIGFVGENNARRATIHAGEYWRMWPDAVCQLAYCRPGEANPYLVALERVGDDVVWTASDTDVQIPGNGWAQLIFSVPDKGIIGKSKLLPVSIGRSLGTPGEVPEGMRIYADEIAESASRAEIAQEAAEAALQKLIDGIESGDFKGDPGEPGKDGKDGSDGFSPSVRADREDDGVRITITDKDGTTSAVVHDGKGGGISDVQVNGASVVQDGVANVPTAYFSRLGAVLIASDRGVTATPTGQLRIVPPTYANIDNRAANKEIDNYLPLTLRKINYAVTASLTDANHIVLTAEQQATAQEVLGVNKNYELLIDHTQLEEGNFDIVFNDLTKGYTDFLYFVEVTQVDKTHSSNIYTRFSISTQGVNGWGLQATQGTTYKKAWQRYYVDGGFIRRQFQNVYTVNNNGATPLDDGNFVNRPVDILGYPKSIYSVDKVPAGFRIRIYAR